MNFNQLFCCIERSANFKFMAKSKKQSSEKIEVIDEQYVRKESGKMTDKQVKKVVVNADEIKDTFKSSGLMGRYIEDARLMISLIKDYWKGNYRKILWFSIAATVFALLYVWNPLDFIPDFIPFIGFADDVVAFSTAFKLVEKDLMRYKAWKLKQGKPK